MRTRLILSLAVTALALVGCGPQPQVAKPPDPPATPPADTPPTTRPQIDSPPTAVVPKPPEPPKPPPPKPDAPSPLQPGDVKATKTLSVDVGKVTGFTLSPDGGTFGVVGYEKGKPEGDGHASFYFDLATGKRVGPPLRMNGPGQLATGGKSTAYMNWQIDRDSDVLVWEVAAGKPAFITRVKNGTEPFVFTPDGKLIVTARGSELAFVKVPGGKPAFPTVKTADPILALSAAYLDGTRVATLHGGGVVRVWDLSTGKEADVLDTKWAKKGKGPNALRVAPDGVAMVVGDSDTGERAVWDLKAKRVMEWAEKQSSPFGPSYEPVAGGMLQSKGDDYSARMKDGFSPVVKFVSLLDLQSGKVVRRLLLPEDPDVWEQVRVTNDGRRVVLFSTKTSKLFVWDIPAEK